MKTINLMNIDVLVHHTFYRGYPLFTWIENHPSMDELDKEAIAATIMDALVYHRIIHPKKHRLDLEHLCIVKSKKKEYYAYQKHPFVCGIPMWIKEKYRCQCTGASKHSPVSLFLTDHTGGQPRCIYDMNLAAALPFSDFTLCEIAYDSPTRKGIRVEKRQFPKIKIYGEDYFIDVLTRRIFLASEFIKRYQGVILEEATKEDMIKRNSLFYDQESASCIQFDFYIIAKKLSESRDIFDSMFSENYYELEKSKEYFPQEWEKAEKELEKMKEQGFIEKEFHLGFTP